MTGITSQGESFVKELCGGKLLRRLIGQYIRRKAVKINKIHKIKRNRKGCQQISLHKRSQCGRVAQRKIIRRPIG